MRNAYACTLALLLLSTPALATWREASTEKFIVYSDGSEKVLHCGRCSRRIRVPGEDSG